MEEEQKDGGMKSLNAFQYVSSVTAKYTPTNYAYYLMSNVNTEGLPPEMQQRIADIIEKAKATAPQQQQAPQQPAAPIQRPPTLMDHTVALRQEVAALRQELHAVAQVTDAVGQAVGQLYQTFLGQSEITDQSGTYRAAPQPQLDDNNDY